MIIEQIYDDSLSHSSYFIKDREKAIVIDPRRDIDIYLQKAREKGCIITHIFETHLHADFISGHLELATETGAGIYGPKKADFGFHHTGLVEGDTIKVEDLVFKVIETPGHTPEIICYIAYNKKASDKEPVCLFSGDTLFVGDVGRPDLFPGRSGELASSLFSSLNKKILKLSDFCEVYPAHGPGSLCGKSIGNRRKTTIGYEKITNSILKIKELKAFKKRLLKDMPKAPDYFSRSSEINRTGPVPLSILPSLKQVSSRTLRQMMEKDPEGLEIIDCREYMDFAAAHIQGSINIYLEGSFAPYAGWFADNRKITILLVDDHQSAKKASKLLRRVGFDNTIYYLNKGMTDWINNGYGFFSFGIISIREFSRCYKTGNCRYEIIDVREEHEYMQGHFKDARNIPFNRFAEDDIKLDKDKKYILHCSTGIRSSIACSFLLRKGYRKVNNLAGGMLAFMNSGNSL